MIRILSKTSLRYLLSAAIMASVQGFSPGTLAQPIDISKPKSSPPLIITEDPLPEDLSEDIYSYPKRTRDIMPGEIAGEAYFTPTDTVVGQKVRELQDNVLTLQQNVSSLATEYASLQSGGQNQAAEYYANIATINTQLQAGTTPGNPRLEQRLIEAQKILKNLSQNLVSLNQLAGRISNVASNASFLQETVRSAYNLSGAVEEDHVHLARLEDQIHNTIVVIERLLNNVNDNITRASAYLSVERKNLRTLAVAVANGSFLNKSLTSKPFSNAAGLDQAAVKSDDSPGKMAKSALPKTKPSSPRPLMKIKFDRSDVNYEQALYVALNEAMQRYPEAEFELIAVYPEKGNAAKVAIEMTRARRNAEKVLRSMEQIGLPQERVNLSTAKSENAQFNEVHLYIR